jgi:MerR family copper efflux transcriptional regulator
MNISEAAQGSGLSAKTIRYYEQIELIAAPRRAANGYRDYDEKSLAELRFVHRARQVGFSVDECRQLLQIQRDPGRQSAHVKGLVLEKCDHIEARIEQLRHMSDILQTLAGQCSGDEGPECAILEELEREELVADE